MPWENGRKPQGKSGDSLPSCLPGLQPQAPAQGPRARQVHLRVPCPEIPGGKPEGPAGGEDRGCFLRQQGKIRRPPCHRGPAERRGEVGKVAANLLARGFTAEGPDRKFVTDVTEFKLPDGKLYLSPVMDLYSRRIVGYSISPRPDFAQIRERMENAFGGREGKVRGALFHSDQGWQYQRKEFGDILEGYGMVQSMSRKGNCHDNSAMENFFGRLKVEMFYGEEACYSDYGSLKKALRDYIAWYNSSRLKEYLHWKSPQEALSNSGTL